MQSQKSILSRKILSVLFVLVTFVVGPSEAQQLTAGGPTCRWSEHESRLTSFMARIRSFEKEIADMIESKKKIENAEKLKILTQQISFKHSDLAKAVKDYEDERRHMRFQHPDRDLEDERKYTSQKLKSLDEIEFAFGLDGRLDRIRRQVEVVFPVAPAADAEGVRGPAGITNEKDDDVPRGIKLVK